MFLLEHLNPISTAYDGKAAQHAGSLNENYALGANFSPFKLISEGHFIQLTSVAQILGVPSNARWRRRLPHVRVKTILDEFRRISTRLIGNVRQAESKKSCEGQAGAPGLSINRVTAPFLTR